MKLLAYTIGGLKIGIDIKSWNDAMLGGNSAFQAIADNGIIPSGYVNISSFDNWANLGSGAYLTPNQIKAEMLKLIPNVPTAAQYITLESYATAGLNLTSKIGVNTIFGVAITGGTVLTGSTIISGVAVTTFNAYTGTTVPNTYTTKSSYLTHTGNTNIHFKMSGITTGKRVSFGNIMINNFTLPITYTTSIGAPFGERYHKHIKDNYNDHNKFLFDIYCENGTMFEGLQFPTTDNMVTFLNNNIPTIGGSQSVRYTINCYAKESQNVGEISKIYGINLFYSILKGKRCYKKKIKTFYDGVYSTSSKYDAQKNNLVTALWNYFTFAGFMQPSNYVNGAKAIWFSQTISNAYGLLHSGNTITFNGISGDRMCFNWGDSNFEAQGANTMKVVSSAIVGLRIGYQDFLIAPFLRDIDYYNNYSYIQAYKLQGKNSANDDITAILLKPIGQDTFRLNYIKDIAHRDLYIIYYEGDNDHQPVIKRLTGVNRPNDIVGDVSFLVNKTDWNIRPEVANEAMSTHIGQSKMKAFRFFFGDDYGNISPCSPEVTPYVHRNGAKLINLISKI